VLPAELPEPALDPSATSRPDRPRLALVQPPPEPDAGIPFETGLVRFFVIGAAIGFALIFALVGGGLLASGIGLVYALPAAAFVAAFGGIGFGAMEGAALHKPRPPKDRPTVPLT
jgi:hypothetical protein